MARLKEQYNNEIVPKLKEELGLSNALSVPKIEKITINMGLGSAQGNAIGCKVTLRKERMYEFLDRLVNIAIPRVRDFRGLSDKSFDGRGNYNMGINEQIVFPEIDFEKITKVRGMDIAITTNAQNDDDAKKLLAMFNFPFKG